MKRLLRRPSTFIVIMAIGTLGLSILAAQQLALTKTDDGSKKIVTSTAFAPLSLAAYPINRLKIDPRHPWDTYITQSHLRADREQVEVLARSITFPPVLKQGERMISVEYPNATILCLEAAYYAGQAQGLILAMDRDSVVEHKLLWTIDNAGDLFDSCLNIYLREAFDDTNANNKKELGDVRAVLSEQIRLIQEKLRYAKNLKTKAPAFSVTKYFAYTDRHRQEGPLP